MLRNFGRGRRVRLQWLALAGMLLGVGPAAAQVQTIDPDTVIARDIGQPVRSSPAPAVDAPRQAEPLPFYGEAPDPAAEPIPDDAQPGFDFAPPPPAQPSNAQDMAAAPPAGYAAYRAPTYRKEELVAASQSVFGKGARDVAAAIGDVLNKQGEPNGYIVGTEGGGAFIFGLRYGSGTLYQKAREPRPVYWNGPSLGFDAGMAAGDTFVLVYNLDDPEALFSRYGSGEGQAYVLGGVHVSYLRKDNVVLIPVRMGVGLRLGVNAGYMKFSRKQNLLPF